MRKSSEILLITFLLLSQIIYAQKIKIYILDTDKKSTVRLIAKDSIKAREKVNFYIHRLHNQGWLEASADSLLWQNNKLKVLLHKGKKYFLDTLKIITSSDTTIINYRKQTFSYPFYQNLIQQKINELKNNGYPFAHIQAEQCQLINNHFSCQINISTEGYFVYDTLKTNDSSQLNRRFLWTYLNLKPCAPYNQTDIENISKRLQHLQFVQINSPPQIYFYPGLAQPVLNLKKQANNSAEGMIGFKLENKKLSSVGHLNIRLNGLLQAETFGLLWEKPRENWQQIKIEFSFPYVFGTPIGTQFDFFNQKIDTSQINIKLSGGMVYYLQYFNNIGINFQQELNYSVNQSNNFRNVKKNYLSTLVYIDTRDNPFNPSQGWLINGNFAYGQKIYNDSTKSIRHFRIELKKFFSINSTISVLSKILSEGYYSSQIFDNEVMHIGGYEDFRGFAEKQIPATSYFLLTVEPRLLFNRSNLFLFAEKGFIYTKTVSINENIQTLAFGMGINLHTKNAIINITYAIGSTNNQFNLQASKIHLSYKAIF